jgi:hypothetical protein
MALSTLKPTTRIVSVLINAIELKDVLDRVGVRATAPVTNETVFGNEGTSGENTVGTEQLTLSFAGPLRRGTTAATPFMPLSAYQGKSFVIQADTSITVSGTCNFFDAGFDLTAGGAARSGPALANNTGSYALAWNTAS